MELNIIFTLLIIHYIGLFIFKPIKNTLACGLFGWAGKSYKQFNRDKFNILGIFNDSRGGHSCGYTADGDIFVGIDKEKKFIDFIAKYPDYDGPKNVPIVFGHTRFATGGAHNAANAHPFGFGSIEDKGYYEFIAAHNGSLHNHKEFCKQYGIDHEEKIVNTDKGYQTTTWRQKIDSEILLECIYKSGNFKVLSDYEGAAALIFMNLNEPNVLYCFHGATPIDKYGADQRNFIERPLWYYKKGKNDLYISSIPESLQAIGAVEDKTLFEFECNTVYKITDGDVDNAEKIRISRKGRYQKPYSSYSFRKSDYVPSGYSSKGKKDVKGIGEKEEDNIVNIYDEKVDHTNLKGKIYMEKLRYKRNGHKITGVYTWINNYGFYPLTINSSDAQTLFWQLVGKKFDYNEAVFIDPSKQYDKDTSSFPIPFSVDTEVERLFYIYDGVMLQTQADYNSCFDRIKINKPWTWVDLSMMSKHPIIDDSVTRKPNNYQNIRKDDRFFTGNINPLGSGKIYNIQIGDLKSIKDIPKNEEVKTETKDVIPLNSGIDLNKEPSSRWDLEDDLTEQGDNFVELLKDKFEETNKQFELPLNKEDNKIDNCILEDKLEKIFTPKIIELQGGKRELQKFLPMKKAEEAIVMIDCFIESAENLVIKEEK